MIFFIGIGVLFCSFWIAQIIFVRLHTKWSSKQLETNGEDAVTPVSVIHPIKDLDYELELNLESWADQKYAGKVEHIFSFQDVKDPAIEVVHKFIEKHTELDAKIIVNPVAPGLNGKSSNMVNGIKAAKYDMIAFGDSDLRVKPDFLIKMIRPLKEEKVGVTTCGQLNIGGSDFWTRFFTFVQNSETDFMWALLTKLGIDVGMTGAAFAMRRKFIEKLGGLEVFGGSLLEDLHLGNTINKLGYKVVLGPFLECHVDTIPKEKSFNYAKRIATGIRTHIAVELPAFIAMLFWYWAIFIWAAVTVDERLLLLSFVFICIRIVHGLMQRVVSLNKIKPVDLFIPLMFDLFGTFYLLYAFRKPEVTWRGIKYEVGKGGYITENREQKSENRER